MKSCAKGVPEGKVQSICITCMEECPFGNWGISPEERKKQLAKPCPEVKKPEHPCPKCGGIKILAFPVDTITKSSSELPRSYHELCWCGHEEKVKP